MVTRMSEARFEALAMWCRNPGSRLALANCSFFSADEERLIGGVYFIRATDRLGYVLLARDKHDRYQTFSNIWPFLSARAAERDIHARLATLECQKTPDVPMRLDTQKGVNLFAPIAGAKLNPKFLNLRDGRHSSAARELLREIATWVVDMDGNLVRAFASRI
jgi:hypothetical protein